MAELDGNGCDLGDIDDGEEFDLNELLGELMEAEDQINSSARQMVDMVRGLVEHRAEYAPLPADAKRVDAEWYAATQQELVGAGFSALGDFDDIAYTRTNPESESYCSWGLSDDGKIAAMWLSVMGAEGVPSRCVSFHSWLKDERVVLTARGCTGTGLPMPPSILDTELPASVSLLEALDKHKKVMSEAAGEAQAITDLNALIDAFAYTERVTAEWREEQGLELFEPMFRHMLGDGFDEMGPEYLDAINANPHWWTGEEPEEDPDEQSGPLAQFLASHEADGERMRLATFGLMFRMMPELQMRHVAANHCRAARYLMNAVATLVVEKIKQDSISIADLEGAILELPESEPPITVKLTMESVTDDDGDDTELLCIQPPGSEAQDEWLRESCARLGEEIPPAKSYDTFEAEMDAASEKARHTLGEIRDRFSAGLPADQSLLIKTGLKTSEPGRLEFVWVYVTGWEGGVVTGNLAHAVNDCPGYEEGQELKVAEADVFDRTIIDSVGNPVEPGVTDTVAMDYGVDI